MGAGRAEREEDTPGRLGDHDPVGAEDSAATLRDGTSRAPSARSRQACHPTP
jgi:hypothetical protein